MKILLALIVAVMFVGCVTIPQGTTPSTSPIVSGNGVARPYVILGKAEGSAGSFSLFGFIPFGRTNIDKAINEAIYKYNGENLINVTYNVTSTYCIIGYVTSLTVKGDVIKYVDKYVENEDMTGDKSIIPYQPIDKGISAYHRFTLGSAINGFSADYSLIQPMNDFLYWSLNIGYKNYSISGSSTGNYSYYNYNTGSYSYYPYSFPYDASFYTIPITFNFGVSAKSLINIPNIPLNPYASIGLAYVPMFGADQSGYSSIDDRFDQVGINFNIGAEYLLVKGLAVGLEYRYLKSFVDLPAPVNSGLGFSNLNISLTYHP